MTLGPGFHLIYGPNEAGKSTTLRAIRQLLFGFDERTTDNFVHQNPNLRIGGVLSDRSGAQLEVVRRKTRKDSLRGADETTVIDDSQWQPFLCGVDEATFTNRYGIDYAQLVEGGRQIATGSGDLGEILFASGSGVMDLAEVQRRLNEEAAELFKPQGKKQRLNQAIIEWQLQRDLVIQKQRPVTEWEEIDRLRSETQARLDLVSKELTLKSNARDLYRRWQQALPVMQELDASQLQLKVSESVVRLPADFGGKRQEAMVLLKHADSQAKSEKKKLEQIQKDLDQISIPAGLLEQADELTRLLTKWGEYSKAQVDRKGLVAQYDALMTTIADLRRGISTEQASVEPTSIDRTQRTRISQLGRRQASLQQVLQQSKNRSERLLAQIGEAKASLSGNTRGASS